MKLDDAEGNSDVMEQDIALSETTCPSCYAEFLDEEDLDIHIKQMHPVIRPKPCQLCPETYKDQLEYAVHVRDAHLMDLRCCQYCSKAFLNGGILRLHERKHEPDNVLFSCSQCSAMFSETKLLELHERKTHDNDVDGVFLKCLPYLSSILKFKVVPLLQSMGKKIFVCICCNFSSVNLNVYIKHGDDKCECFVCSKCSCVFKSKKYLKKHVKYTKKCICIEEYSDENIRCKDCNKFVHPKAMQVHSQNCNALKCVDCNFICKSIDELSEHQTTEHPAGMNFLRCKFCAKELIGEGPLKKHIHRVHRPNFHLYKYQCKDCKTIFKHPQKLFAHFFTKHKDLEPFTCKICNKKFRVRKSFSLHIKLNHKSVGFVEFDDQYHVFFTANKSKKPFVPECILPPEDLYDSEDENEENSRESNQPVEIHLSDTDATNVETEDDNQPIKKKPTPIRNKTKTSLIRVKSKKQKRTSKKQAVLIYSSDEEPLLEVRKRALRKQRRAKRPGTWKKNYSTQSLFTCEICDKNCYTFQNHQNHMNTHNKNQELECVKCSHIFNSKSVLNRHMRTEHASSKLTETLKNLLMKKQRDEPIIPVNKPTKVPNTPSKFKIIMNKVKMSRSDTSATIKPVEPNLSVKNFIENFTPDINDPSPNGNITLNSSITIKPFYSPYQKDPIIKLTKFNDFPIYETVPLKMPQRFKRYDSYVKTKISINLVPKLVSTQNYVLPDFDHNYTETHHGNFEDEYDRNDIPEVAHEVSLEGTEEPSNQTLLQTKIVIPKMPKGYPNIHIATLQSEAPYFKIIKVNSEDMTEIIDGDNAPAATNEVINLPGGTKLVTANPLAHLLGDHGDKIFELNAKKYYKPVIRDFSGIIVKAMKKLEEAPPSKKRKTKPIKKAVTDNEEIIED